MNPFFSIIMPTYNRADLLPVAIDSVINQSFKNWELIIVDDGSKDDTRQVITSYTDSRIKYIYQDNAERSAARNNGIKNAIGTYICFLDSDDYYLPDRLYRLYNRLEEKLFPVSFFYTGLQIENSTGLAIRHEKQITGNIFDHIACSVIHSQQVCVHRSIFDQYKYDTRFHIGEDVELWLRIAAQHPFIYLDNEYTVVVVNHEERSVNIKHYNSFLHHLNMLKSVFNENHPGRNISKPIKQKILSNCYFGVAKYYIYSGSRANAFMSLLKSIAINPSNYQTRYRINILIKLLLPDGIKIAANLLE